VQHCAALALRQITHVGIADAATPYSMVRTNLSGSYMMACFAGHGRILLDGRWQVCRAGHACLAPPHVLHAFHAVPAVRWGFCWVRYEQPPEQAPVITSASPVLAPFNPEPLRCAILGLYHAHHDAASPAILHHWIELIHSYVRKFATPWSGDDRLWQLWETVSENPGNPWTISSLAERVHCSGEHLRRLCRKQLGRSPMQHLIFLRMQRAAELLATTPEKIETIARSVGYENPFVFSNTFKRWIGWRPSEYRSHKATKPAHPPHH
jgi:AraC-like DNA-binding protein